MSSFRKLSPRAAILAAAAVILGMAAPANAGFKVTLSESGFADQTIVGSAPGSINFPASYGTFTLLNGSAFSDSPGGVTLSELLSTTLRVTNNDAATRTLTITVTSTDYTLPAGSPLEVDSQLGGTSFVGGQGNLLTFQSYADKNNNEFGEADFTTHLQNVSYTGNSFDTGTASGLFARTGAFSVTSVVTLTEVAGGQVQFTGSTTLRAVPAPPTALLALGSVPLLGLGSWLRRRAVRA